MEAKATPSPIVSGRRVALASGRRRCPHQIWATPVAQTLGGVGWARATVEGDAGRPDLFWSGRPEARGGGAVGGVAVGKRWGGNRAVGKMSFQDLESGRGIGSRRGYLNGKQDPTQAVASGIFQINTAVSSFQRLVNTLGTPKDTPELREKLASISGIPLGIPVVIQNGTMPPIWTTMNCGFLFPVSHLCFVLIFIELLELFEDLGDPQYIIQFLYAIADHLVVWQARNLSSGHERLLARERFSMYLKDRFYESLRYSVL
ncbi:syntaxin [Sesamum angolense]|uniref:Syntaxin n=1 Tax=Sesamum angolense TaxID=2727404 RepID=A0AAE1WWP5_9LAMI|nr:syntaxin [Sesamum angolense]